MTPHTIALLVLGVIAWCSLAYVAGRINGYAAGFTDGRKAPMNAALTRCAEAYASQPRVVRGSEGVR